MHAGHRFFSGILDFADFKNKDNNKIKVFNKGTPKESNTGIPTGGQTDPISIDGAKLECKKAQKNEIKNITSDKINKDIPKRKPNWTLTVCLPKKVPSLTTSFHHENIENNNKNKPNCNKIGQYLSGGVQQKKVIHYNVQIRI